LAPQLVEEIFAIVGRLNKAENVGFLVAEQNTNIALRYAQYGYILENGRVVMDGTAAALLGAKGIPRLAMAGVRDGAKPRNTGHIVNG
jgi:branched-chain amino acid transport system ATP-binding protein